MKPGLTGPSFLWNTELPNERTTLSVEPDDPELKRVHTLASITDNSCASMHERWSKFSSWQTLRKVVAYCLLYKNILRYKVESRQNLNARKPSAELNVELLREAENEIIKSAQRFAFPEEVASLESLSGKGYEIKQSTS